MSPYLSERKPTVIHYHPLSPETSPLASPRALLPESPPPLYPLGPFTLPLPCHHPSLHTFSPPCPSLPPYHLVSTFPYSLPANKGRGGEGVKLLLISGWPLPLGHILRGSTWLLTWPSAIKTCVFSARGPGNRCVLMLGWMCVWQRSDRRQTGSQTTAQPLRRFIRHPTGRCSVAHLQRRWAPFIHAPTSLSYPACWLVWKGGEDAEAHRLNATLIARRSCWGFLKPWCDIVSKTGTSWISFSSTHSRPHKAHTKGFHMISTGWKEVGEKRQVEAVS